MKILEKIEKTIDCWFLIFIAFIFFLLRLPSLFEPYWYGDEGIYQAIGMGIRDGRLLYSGIWDNKPPLLYMLYALFSSDQFTVRLVSLLFGVLSIFVFYALSRKIFREKKSVLIATSFFAVFFGLPILEGNIANAENFMLLPILLAGLLIFNAISNPNDKKLSLSNFQLSTFNFQLISAGFLLGLALLFKIVAVFDFAAFFLFLLFLLIDKKKQLIITLQNLFVFCASFALPIFITALFFLANRAFGDFVTAAFKQNVGYVGYGNKLLIPQGFLLLKLFFLGIASLYFFSKRQVLGNSKLFIFLWFSFSFFNAFFSQRPYTHYVLVLLPSFSLLVGLLFEKQYQKTVTVILLVATFVISFSFTFFVRIQGYYQNYLSFVFFNKSVSDYQNFFDKNTPGYYTIASYLKIHTTKDDQVFIWGNSAQTYVLSGKLPPGRYTVAYHILSSQQSLEETQQAIQKVKPKYIVVSPAKLYIPFRLFGYTQKIMLYNALIYERVF